jgi:RNA polymerase sigma factor (sigma-70 family)
MGKDKGYKGALEASNTRRNRRDTDTDRMSESPTFAEFMERVRAGDQQAAAELVHQYESLIRREVRLHLEDRRLCRVFDSMDVCQSVLGSFFLRVAAGQYDLERPEQLIKLLVTMTRNKLASAARQQHRQRRDQRRVVGDAADQLAHVADPTPGPGSVVSGQELLKLFREGLSDEERQLVDLRAEGLAWADIALRLGGTPEARRMQLTRTIERMARALGVESVEAWISFD